MPSFAPPAITPPRQLARVLWAEGMHLAPQHFQAQRRHAEEAAAFAIDLLVPFGWGLSGVGIDTDALRNGTLALAHARGIFPDGTPFDVPESDPTPAPRLVAPSFSPTRESHIVYLALPRWRTAAANVATDDTRDDDAARFRAAERILADEGTGGDPQSVRFAAKNFRLAFDDDVRPDELTLPLVRLRRDGAGAFEIDPEYVPACLRLDASPRLLVLLRRLIDMLDAKAGAVLAQQGAASGASIASSYAGSELASFWLVHALRSAEAPLRHLLATRRSHPERLWLELARLAGSLCTFALDTVPRDLPVYDHDDLGSCFTAMETHLRARLDVTVASNAVVVSLTRAADFLHIGALPDPRCMAPGSRWFLGVRSAAGAAATAERVPRLAKLCGSKFVLELVRRAYQGLTLEHVPAPPPAIAPRPELQYFSVSQDGPCWQSLLQTREVGVYLPDALPEAVAELVVLVPG